MIPKYAKLTGDVILPKGGPDRVRFCMWYADAMDEGKDHFESLRQARRYMWMMYCYKEQGILNKLGPSVGGIPVEYLGEE